MTIHQHIAEAVQVPDIVRLKDNLYVMRFECMKVYSTMTAVETLLHQGRIQPGDTLLDSSSGIYAYALALACHRYGLKCHIVGSKTVDKSLRVQLELLGATVEGIPASESLKLDQEHRVTRIHALLEQNPHMHWMQQYHDDIHYLGYRACAEQFVSALGPDAPAEINLVGGVGSGCSTGGIAHFLREAGLKVSQHAIQPFGSVTFGSEQVEDPAAIIAGIGSAIPFNNVRHSWYKQVHWMSFLHCLSGSVALMKQHAIFAGLSAGAGYLVSSWLQAHSPEKTTLFIAPDTGHRYVDAVFSRHQLAEPIDRLKPQAIQQLSELEMPWSVARWQDIAPSFTTSYTRTDRARNITEELV